MPVKTRITKAPDERRSELIAAAQQLFYTKGYENTSVNDIVKAVDVAKGTFYHYFDSKVEILEAHVEDLTEQALAIMRPIIADEALSAIEKWRQMFQATGSWKTEHKPEMLALVQVLYSPENFLLRHKIELAQLAKAVPEVSKVIEQGVSEGVFDVEHVMESAEIAFSIMRSSSDYLADLILNPTAYANPATLAQKKFDAIQIAVERILDAPRGSLPLTNSSTLAVWFSD